MPLPRLLGIVMISPSTMDALLARKRTSLPPAMQVTPRAASTAATSKGAQLVRGVSNELLLRDGSNSATNMEQARLDELA